MPKQKSGKVVQGSFAEAAVSEKVRQAIINDLTDCGILSLTDIEIEYLDGHEILIRGYDNKGCLIKYRLNSDGFAEGTENGFCTFLKMPEPIRGPAYWGYLERNYHKARLVQAIVQDSLPDMTGWTLENSVLLAGAKEWKLIKACLDAGQDNVSCAHVSQPISREPVVEISLVIEGRIHTVHLTADGYRWTDDGAKITSPQPGRNDMKYTIAQALREALQNAGDDMQLPSKPSNGRSAWFPWPH